MSAIDPTKTTMGDLCTAALEECGAFGMGQTPTKLDITGAWTRCQWMLQQWARKRWMVYHLLDYSIVSTGALSYSVGPGGDINTVFDAGQFNQQFNTQFGGGGPPRELTVRPARVESAFVRQIQNVSPNQVDYSMKILQSREDYNRISLKRLQSFPQVVWYDPDWPLGHLFVWPIPQPGIYEVHIAAMCQLPAQFMTVASEVTLPYEYYAAMYLNLATRLWAKYGIPPRPDTANLAKEALSLIKGNNTAIASLVMPTELGRGGRYNIFSDTNY